jgi:CheY-like chemotaxis protein
MTEQFDLFIIDDDPTVIKLMMSMLSNYQLNIKTFTDPLEGLGELSKNPPKVIFLDYNMPSIDAKKFIIKMSEQYLFQFSSVYLITGMSFDNVKKEELHSLGFSQVISKPFKKEDLLKALKEIIGDIIEKN